ncbi:MAG: methyltransferase [Candidatus Kapabacteria bacterium]|nr:methyltransferase [Ignavibacteriota bacterium]MCW5885627.1 methyltransferase [Candidatus Kapabacteria bacterium]
MSHNYNLKKIENSLEFIEDIAFAFKKSRVLLTASELNVFEAIGYRSLSAKEIAEALHLDIKSTERLLNALVGIDLLEKKDQNYNNTEASLKHLLRGSDAYIGSIEHLADLWDTWTNLTETVRQGKPLQYNTLQEKSPEWLHAFVNSIFWRSSIEAPNVVSHLHLKGVNRVLDLGGGKGAFTCNLIKASPTIKVTLFDLPQVIPYAEEYLSTSGVRDQVNLLAGDFTTDDIGSGYDMILLSNVISFRSIWENVTLLQKCFDALNHGGQIVIYDMVINDSRTKPLNHTLFSLNMLLNTMSGDAYTETDIWIMLREAWFRDISRIETKFDSSIMIGIR